MIWSNSNVLEIGVRDQTNLGENEERSHIPMQPGLGI